MCLKIHFFVGNPSWMAPCSDLICVNPIFYVIDKVKSYGKKFKRSEVRMTDSNQVKCADCEIYLYIYTLQNLIVRIGECVKVLRILSVQSNIV